MEKESRAAGGREMPRFLALQHHVNFLPSSNLRFSQEPNFHCPPWKNVWDFGKKTQNNSCLFPRMDFVHGGPGSTVVSDPHPHLYQPKRSLLLLSPIPHPNLCLFSSSLIVAAFFFSEFFFLHRRRRNCAFFTLSILTPCKEVAKNTFFLDVLQKYKPLLPEEANALHIKI